MSKENLLRKLERKNLIAPPEHVINGLQYLTIMGSFAYGVNMDNSDLDIYGFSIPPKELVFPHLQGEIHGFGRQVQRFEQYQQHHIQTEETEYDISVYSIIKYFQLCMENNPNMIDSLFTDRTCVIYETNIAKLVRENRKLFLHKGSWHKFKGYAFSQLNKAQTKNPDKNSKRYESIQKFGFDVKFAYHVVRLVNEAEQILMHHDIDLRQNNRHLIAIRNGEYTFDEIKQWFVNKEMQLEELYLKSDLQKYPDEEKIKTLLLNCLEEYYGNISDAVINNTEIKYKNILEQIKQLTKNI